MPNIILDRLIIMNVLLYEIFIPKGARVSRSGSNGYEECVLPRYSRFKCISNETSKDGLHNIKLEYILPVPAEM